MGYAFQYKCKNITFFFNKQNQKFTKTIDLRRQDILDENFYHEVMAKEPINSDMFIIYQEGENSNF